MQNMKMQKVFPPIIRKLIYTTGFIWFLVIIALRITKPDLSNRDYFIVSAPLFLIFLFAGYAVCWSLYNAIIDWLAFTANRREIKNKIRNNIVLIIILLLISQILR
jgi:hypothetical protein